MATNGPPAAAGADLPVVSYPIRCPLIRLFNARPLLAARIAARRLVMVRLT